MTDKEDNKKCWRMFRVAYFIIIGYFMLRFCFFILSTLWYGFSLKLGTVLIIIGVGGLTITLLYYFLIYLVNIKFFHKRISGVQAET